MSYLNSITLVGFVGSDPDQRQAKRNGSKFTVLSVATQRSGKNAGDEWSSKVEWHRVVVFRPRLAEHVAATIKKGAHILVEGSLVSSTYVPSNGKSKKAKAAKITSWSIRAAVVRKLDRGEPEPDASAATEAPESDEAALALHSAATIRQPKNQPSLFHIMVRTHISSLRAEPEMAS
jgi:single stranded DNA-binding protein